MRIRLQRHCQHLYSRSQNALDNNGDRRAGGINRAAREKLENIRGEYIETVSPRYLWHAFRTREARERGDLIRDMYSRRSLRHRYRSLRRWARPQNSIAPGIVSAVLTKTATGDFNESRKFTWEPRKPAKPLQFKFHEKSSPLARGLSRFRIIIKSSTNCKSPSRWTRRISKSWRR